MSLTHFNLQQSIVFQSWANSSTKTPLSPLKLPRDDGEGPDGTGGLQLQGGQETFRGLAGAQWLQGLAQTAPRLVGGAVDLNGITQNLLSQVHPLSFYQQTALHG